MGQSEKRVETTDFLIEAAAVDDCWGIGRTTGQGKEVLGNSSVERQLSFFYCGSHGTVGIVEMEGDL